MPRWKIWLLAVRVRTLPAAIVPVWAGCVLAYELRGVFDLSMAVATLLGAIAIQIATNFFNDVIDADKGADSEERVGPVRVTASGMLSRRRVLRGAFVMLGVATLCGFYLMSARGWWIAVIGVPSLYLSYGYTGGPFPLAYRGFGEVFVILFFGFVAVAGTVFVQLGFVPFEAWILGFQVGCLSAVLIAINNYRDLEVDRAAGKRTIVVRFGRSFTSVFILVMTLLPYCFVAFSSPLSGATNSWVLLRVGAGAIFFWLIRSGMRQAQAHGGRVEASLLPIAALHLLVFVLVQTVVMSLTFH